MPTTYVDIAAASYGDSLTSARQLQQGVQTLVNDPSADTMQ
ncbi:hypothetical protein [Paracoccus sediminilitoris]|nr:hypothetical protein [Paracoccus sediminilitoris]